MDVAERERMRNDFIAARLDVARLEAALAAVANSDNDPLAQFHPPESASPEVVSTQQRFLLDQVAEHRAKLAALGRRQAEKEAELATIDATIAKLQAIIPILDQRVDIRQTLLEHNTGSKWNYLEILQAATEQKAELKVQQSRRVQAEAAIAGIIATRAQTEAEFGSKLSGELAEAQRKAGSLAQALVKAEEKVRLQRLTASVDGIVQQLAVHTIGGVVTPAQTLLVIVPEESHLEIEANVSNRDIGFIRAGQPAEIKVDTFNYTRYGLLHGQVVSVSQDAITRVKEPNAKSVGEPTSEPKGQELDYAARISLDRTRMQIDGKLVDLSPGMAVTVDIKTGKRRILTYLLSPLIRYGHESLHER
jgi:hemolysin D